VGESSETQGSLDTPHTRRSSLVVLIVSDSHSRPTTIGFIELLDGTTVLQDGRVTSSSKKELRDVITGPQDVSVTSSCKTELADVNTELHRLEGD